ncbi:MAG: hypothetical protein JWQ90_1240 [Hydrocarboniphaga sp.]|uniref:DUF2058 domain-containing protein n=1 Tax=Hydrocarboniphaga sp. TaxID=2033016 RepID=UPI0026169AF4|nr:DUF2058 domain-containing protein [Hydrocarboniphaga sp.]MDB5968790.1 hypothetical protein [Hydrocarboniphaga sp.]
MSLSLRDQLLQAGLINEKQAQAASKQPHHQRSDRTPKKPVIVDPAKIAAEKAAAAKAARDAELNRIQRDKAEQKARRAQVKQLIEQNKLPKVESELLYNFIDGKEGKRIRRIPVTPATRDQLSAGSLSIVRCDGRYEVVPAAIAERIKERDPHAVIPPRAAEPARVDENDPYKDFVVPDDLMW